MKAKSALVLIISVIIIALTGVVAYNGVGENNYLGAQDINLGLDLAGGVSITYEAVKENPTQKEMEAALSVIRTRLDLNHYTEADAYIENANRIHVEIPGVKDTNKAVSDIGKTAMLKFVGVDNTKFYELVQKELEKITPKEDADKKETSKEESATTEEQPVLSYGDLYNKAVEQGIGDVVITGKDVKDATFQKGQISQNTGVEAYVKLELTAEGKEKFAKGTEKYKGNTIAIMLDTGVISEPRVNAVISDGVAIISGMGSDEEAKKLANDIRGGALPLELTPIESNGVGAKLGQDAMNTSLKAGLIGIIIVLLFMAFYYRLPGVAADIALIFYAGAIIVLMSAFGLTLTLPGVAGIILSIGMAVDANVIIFSRIREELALGKGLRASVDAGFKKALSAIVDGNVTTLIAAVVLWYLGTGPIKGFAQTLGLGIIVSMFTALVVTRIILKSFINLGIKNPKLYGAK